MSQDINSIIEQLAEIDSASAKIMQKTQDEKAKYAEYIHKQKQKFDSALQKEVDSAVEEYKKSVELENKQQIANFKENCEKEIERLQRKFKNNGSKWADEIFNNIIKESSNAK